MRLWHPRRATAQERTAWRDRIVAMRLAQPFRQAFRERYTHTSYDMFAGHIVAITPLLGLATRQGWRGDHLDGVLRRELGQWRVELVVSGASLFPGASGFGDVGALHLHRRDGNPVTVDPPGTAPATALPWLPYDEHLLERITHTVVVLVADADPSPVR